MERIEVLVWMVNKLLASFYALISDNDNNRHVSDFDIVILEWTLLYSKWTIAQKDRLMFEQRQRFYYWCDGSGAAVEELEPWGQGGCRRC